MNRLASERTEREARAAGLGEPFMLNGNCVSWSEYGHDHKGESLKRFKEMIAFTALILGPPESIGSHGWSFQETPDLTARWSMEYKLDPKSTGQYDRWNVVVQINAPTGCKIDPRKPRIQGQAPELHPECKAVLEALDATL